MEPWIRQRMLWSLGFLCITYLPAQFAAIRKARGFGRLAAALPLVVMIPVMIAGMQPSAYQGGSLYGMYFICPYLPSMLFLLAMIYVSGRTPLACPRCGHKPRMKSFRLRRTTGPCENCGFDPTATPAAVAMSGTTATSTTSVSGEAPNVPPDRTST